MSLQEIRNLSLRPLPKKRKTYVRKSTRTLRFCVICGDEIKTRSVKVCSDECRVINARCKQRAWEERNAERRRAYYSDRYYRNRETRAAQCRAAYRARKQTPGWPEESRLRARATRQRNFLRRKVMREWGVSSEQACEWIAKGSFPP